MAIPETIKAWAAGFFDGEGAVTISLPRYAMRIEIGQVDPQPLKELQSYWGGTIAPRVKKLNNSRIENRWFLYSNNAKRFMQDIYPYSRRDMVRRKFDIALQFQQETTWNGNRPRSAAYVSRVEKLRLELRQLNTRGMEGELYEQPQAPPEVDPQLSLLE